MRDVRKGSFQDLLPAVTGNVAEGLVHINEAPRAGIHLRGADGDQVEKRPVARLAFEQGRMACRNAQPAPAEHFDDDRDQHPLENEKDRPNQNLRGSEVKREEGDSRYKSKHGGEQSRTNAPESRGHDDRQHEKD